MRVRWRRRSWFLAAAVVAAAAWACKGSTGSLQAGEECHGSSECAPGLVCDFGQTPAVCAGNLTVPPDASPLPDAPPDQPDAPPTPDAPPGTPDAAPTPDAPLAMPDAPLPDAAVPDAALPDA
jgi:hypothetical protein